MRRWNPLYLRLRGRAFSAVGRLPSLNKSLLSLKLNSATLTSVFAFDQINNDEALEWSDDKKEEPACCKACHARQPLCYVTKYLKHLHIPLCDLSVRHELKGPCFIVFVCNIRCPNESWQSWCQGHAHPLIGDKPEQNWLFKCQLIQWHHQKCIGLYY